MSAYFANLNEIQHSIPTLVCFPYLGGNAYVYLNIAKELSGAVNVISASPPGHFGSSQPLINNFDELLDTYFKELEKLELHNYAIFGHSMGAVISYYLTELILNDGKMSKPQLLVLSGSEPPNCFTEINDLNISDEDIINFSERYGVFEYKIEEIWEFVPLIGSILKSDFGHLLQAKKRAHSSIDIDTLIFHGQDDHIVSRDNIELWGSYVAHKDIIEFPDAKHIFVSSHSIDISNCIRKYLTQKSCMDNISTRNFG